MPVEGIDKSTVACVPILSNGDVTGAVALLEVNKAPISELQKSLILAGSQFLGKQLE